MKQISRRKAMQYILTGTAALAAPRFLTGCQANTSKDISATPSILTEEVNSSGNGSTTQVSSAEGDAADIETKSGNSASSYPDMVVARTGEPEALVRAAIDAIGGMQRFIPKSGWVIIKPNICVAYHSYEYAATTNPWVVGALVKMCFEAGAGRVQVMDSPFGGTAPDAYRNSGIGAQVEAAGGEMVQMADFKFKATTIENALSLEEIDMYEDVFQADVLINVPIAKNHSMASLTLGMKNLLGLIKNRQAIHMDFGRRIPDLTSKIKPALTVIDAVRILTNNGPTGGNLDDVRKLDTIIVSPDIVAADSYGATLFGMQPDDLNYIKVAAENNLGRSDLQNLNIRELTVGA